jgi:3-oxosteroid 1-dehydrogenase
MRQALGVEDSRAKALTYLMSMSHGLMQQHLVEAFLDHGPEMVAFLEANTPVQFRPIPEFPDYHAEFPGGMPNGGRSLDCPLYSFHELGEWADKVTKSPYYPSPHFSIYDTPLGQAKPQPLAPEELQRRIDGDLRGSGQALVGRLLRACLDRGIEPKTGHRAIRLLMDGRPRGGRRVRDRRRRDRGRGRRGGARHRRASNGTPICSAPSSAGR